VSCEVGQHFTGVHISHHGAFGNFDLERFTPFTVEVFALTMNPIAGNTVRMIPKGQQGRHIAIRYEPNIATASTIASVRAAHGHGSLSTKRHAARSPVAGAHVQLALVNELAHRYSFNRVSTPNQTV
jgi:hypothetical protein